ncbi:MAG: hypothetical protein EPO32_03060 [Anaerolineae bacterium]|nr:MAG: hypothetical protein EPO32_03060 [Anaerolineae bacterium]
MKLVARISILAAMISVLALFQSSQVGLASPVQPAELAQGKLVYVDIRTEISGRIVEPVKITFIGPAKYVIGFEKYGTGVASNHIKTEMLEGTYAFSYKACNGKHYGGVLVVAPPKTEFVIPPCSDDTYLVPSPPKTSKIVFVNETDAALSLTLDGETEYFWRVPPGEMTLYIELGTYTWAVYTACGDETGELRITHEGFIWIWYCGEHPDLE